MRWTVGLSAPDSSPLAASFDLRGRPRRFALSLVQGYFVEALLAVAATRRECVLLPAAALVQGGSALVLLGGSGVGKSTLTARAAASGQATLGDDQVIVDASGRCWPFRRRARIYPDLRLVAPLAHARLGAGTRSSLRARAIVARLTRGYVAPSLAVAPGRFGGARGAAPLPVGRVVVIDRDARSGAIESEPLRADAALVVAERVIEAQRRHLLPAAGAWPAGLERVRKVERAVLGQLLEAAAVERLGVPRAWTAARAVEQLWRRLGLEPGRGG